MGERVFRRSVVPVEIRNSDAGVPEPVLPSRSGTIGLVDIADLMDGIGDDKKYNPSPLAAFMASKDGLDIAEAMMQLDAHLRRSVIDLARKLSLAQGN